MASENLSSLLVEYEQKRIKAEFDLEKRKKEIYKKYPRLEEIENQISQIAINQTKEILNYQLKKEKIKNEKNKIIKDLELQIKQLKDEKNKILENANIDLNYLKPRYECELCKDTGYIRGNNIETTMCKCLKQRLIDISYNNSNIVNLKGQNFEEFNDKLFSDKVDANKYKFNISPRKNINNIKNASIKFIEDFDNLNSKNLLFSGNTGLGKSYMSNCIANELLKQGKTVLYQTAPVLLEKIIDNKFNKYKTREMIEYNNRTLDVDLLIIDDLGTECLNSMKLSELFMIINTRLLNLNNKPTKTIISTNLSIEQIFNIYEERIGSRIAGYYDIYYFFGEDLRFKTKQL